MKIPHQKDFKALQFELTTVFNAFIRTRDLIDGSYFKCISCGRFKLKRLMHAGHFFNYGHNQALRWDEFNVNGQCSRCNFFLHGNEKGYREGILKKYGSEVLRMLEVKRFNKTTMKEFEITLLINVYNQKLNDFKSARV